jgi:uncharacterized membrane protein YfcA
VPGSLGGLWGYRREARGLRRWFWLLAGPSLVGGLAGSLAAVRWPDAFEMLVPWLILLAATLFALQPRISRLIARPGGAAPKPGRAWAIVGFQLLVAFYGGYFGAGIGILMLAGLAMMGLDDVHQMNALKTLLAVLINGTSAVVFIVAGQVHWPFALAMAAAAVCGGYLGAAWALRLGRGVVRGLVVAIGLSLSAWFFYRQLAG